MTRARGDRVAPRRRPGAQGVPRRERPRSGPHLRGRRRAALRHRAPALQQRRDRVPAIDRRRTSYEDFERVLDVNLWGVVHGTKAFLPHLDRVERRPPRQRLELERLHGAARHEPLLHVEVRGPRVHRGRARRHARGGPSGRRHLRAPGRNPHQHRGRRAREREAGRAAVHGGRRAPPAQLQQEAPQDGPGPCAAKIIVDGVERNRPRVLVGRDARFVDAAVRLLPSRHLRYAVAFDQRLGR